MAPARVLSPGAAVFSDLPWRAESEVGGDGGEQAGLGDEASAGTGASQAAEGRDEVAHRATPRDLAQTRACAGTEAALPGRRAVAQRGPSRGRAPLASGCSERGRSAPARRLPEPPLRCSANCARSAPETRAWLPALFHLKGAAPPRPGPWGSPPGSSTVSYLESFILRCSLSIPARQL